MYIWSCNFYFDSFINGKINTFYIVFISNNKSKSDENVKDV